MADHPADDRFDLLAAGALEPEARAQLADHARGCEGCRVKFDGAVRLSRALSGRDPSMPREEEALALEARSLKGLAAEPAGVVSRWRELWGAWRAAIATVAVAGIALVFLVPTPRVVPPEQEEEWAARGADAGPEATLRVFCGHPGAALQELHEGESCAAGARLAFSLQSELPLPSTVLRVVPEPGRAVELLPPAVDSRGPTPLGSTWLIPEGTTALTIEAEFRGAGPSVRRVLHLRVGATP